MYEFLDGRIASRHATRLVLDVGGIGYDIAVPLGSDFKASPSNEGTRVWTHLVVREDAHLLFGFPDPATRELFRLLLKVRGVGPGLAQAILSSMSEGDLLETIATGDSKALTCIKGVGKKTAAQILLDLRDRAPKPGDRDRSVLVPPSPGAQQRERAMADAISALISIGYSDKQARSSVARAAKKSDQEGELELEALVRDALRE